MFTIDTIPANKLGKTVAKQFLQAVRELLVKQEQVVVAVSGGNTMAKILQKMSDQAASSGDRKALSKIVWIETDAFASTSERPKTNRQVLMEGFFQYAIDCSLVKAENCLFFDTTAVDIKGFSAAAQRYKEKVLARIGSKLDIALFGIGGGVYWPRQGDTNINNLDPGHIAGIFPGYLDIWGDFLPLYILVEQAPKPPQLRLTISPWWLKKCSTLIGVLTGKERLGTLVNLMNDDVSYFDCPAKILKLAGQQKNTTAHLYTDLVIP